jgi:effector-binding domain-containing protein
MTRPGWLRIGAALMALALGPVALAQAPAPVETAPLAPPGGATPPAATIQQPGPPGVTIQQPPPSASTAPPAGTSPQAPALAGRPSLVPGAGDTSNVDEVVLPEKAVLILSGTSAWEEGLKNLRGAFGRVEAEIARLGLTPAGRPLAVFLQTTDDNFRFEAMIPIGAMPTPAPSVGADLRFGTTPSGKAYRFVHKGPYDDIDTTYETVTTYLDAKDILAKDAFIEEYLNDVADPADAALEINIFVQPR